MLTGESTPQWKVPVGDGSVSPAEQLHIKVHKAHVLFGGTKMLQHTPDKGARIRCGEGHVWGAFQSVGLLGVREDAVVAVKALLPAWVCL